MFVMWETLVLDLNESAEQLAYKCMWTTYLPHIEELFGEKITILKNHCFYERRLGDVHSPPLLDMYALNHEYS
jgi:hypothetical protein